MIAVVIWQVRRGFRVTSVRGGGLLYIGGGWGTDYTGLLFRRGIKVGIIGEGGGYSKEMFLTLSFLSHHQGSDRRRVNCCQLGQKTSYSS